MRSIDIVDKEKLIGREEMLGRFWLPFEELYPKDKDWRLFRAAGDVVERCYSWGWYQWLSGDVSGKIYTTVDEVIGKSIRLQVEDSDDYWRAEHDLACAHLAAVGGQRKQIVQLVERMVYAIDAGAKDLCQQAWSGFMKFSLIGDNARANHQADMMFNAVKPINLRLPRKPLVKAWLKKDWNAFNRCLKQSFEAMTANLVKDGSLTEDSEGRRQIILAKRNQRVGGHWQENGLAMLAFEEGVEIETDPIWLPEAMLNGFKTLNR